MCFFFLVTHNFKFFLKNSIWWMIKGNHGLIESKLHKYFKPMTKMSFECKCIRIGFLIVSCLLSAFACYEPSMPQWPSLWNGGSKFSARFDISISKQQVSSIQIMDVGWCKGESMLLEVAKYDIMHWVGIHARDLHILDPSYHIHWQFSGESEPLCWILRWDYCLFLSCSPLICKQASRFCVPPIFSWEQGIKDCKGKG